MDTVDISLATTFLYSEPSRIIGGISGFVSCITTSFSKEVEEVQDLAGLVKDLADEPRLVNDVRIDVEDETELFLRFKEMREVDKFDERLYCSLDRHRLDGIFI